MEKRESLRVPKLSTLEYSLRNLPTLVWNIFGLMVRSTERVRLFQLTRGGHQIVTIYLLATRAKFFAKIHKRSRQKKFLSLFWLVQFSHLFVRKFIIYEYTEKINSFWKTKIIFRFGKNILSTNWIYSIEYNFDYFSHVGTK